MTEQLVIDITREVLWTIIKTAAPLLIISLVVGLIISLFQTITSIQEQTLTFVPKVICVFIGLMIFGSWMLNNIITLINHLWTDFGAYVGK
ncbi:MAG: flagellar biosynthesis protein FliQ [Lachnospiraceae bacterium]|uniref:flagellar biosynthesis protein FliQ n=1 Tax=Falcatimonas sp. MSJ-15 TaxID=2841515 RepID=UPI001C0FE04C|nr:flagellar biosynthesis protein FliQ [Falcatimonas sp. MSJ-15]MBQ5734150.1 flagellar biosynthesis protein FliQ [Lachnospiraceae bacterium]MBU5469654.1 flagellar biosynthesis protein FliQ [Falcatimonas sp. MSJ-15]MEE0960802.1 flagellar biosynthesis protein FliQ [Lachnospiraceae bacterium]